MFDLNKDDDLPVFLCVLSTVEESKTKRYNINWTIIFSNKLLGFGSFKKHLEAKLMRQLECVSSYVEEQVSKRVEEEMNQWQGYWAGYLRDYRKSYQKNSERIAINLLNMGKNINFVA